MQNINAKIAKSVLDYLDDVCLRRRQAGKAPWTKSKIVELAITNMLATDTDLLTRDRVERARKIENRISRNYSVKDQAKRNMEQLVGRVRRKSPSSHFASFGGWIELALVAWLKENDPDRQQAEKFHFDPDLPEE